MQNKTAEKKTSRVTSNFILINQNTLQTHRLSPSLLHHSLLSTLRTSKVMSTAISLVSEVDAVSLI